MSEVRKSYLKRELSEGTKDTLRNNLSTQKAKLSPDPVCDFCGSPHPKWIYAAQRMSTGAEVPCWRWCACDDCSESIEQGTVNDVIVAKVVKWLRSKEPGVPERYLRAAAVIALQAFWRDAMVSPNIAPVPVTF